MGKQYWVVTRPKRKLILIPDLLKIFYAVTQGRKWKGKGQRGTQTEFEKALIEAQWKAQHTSKDGSGARTYASLLFMLGLWFEDDNGVQLTNAGEELVNDNPPVPILTKQLLDLQYPSPYSTNKSVRIDSSFHLHPYRFILELFLTMKLDEITQEEVGYCVVPYAKNKKDLQTVYEKIICFREAPAEVISQAVADSGATADNLCNIGNTIVNQFEYTGFFEERDETKSLKIIATKVTEIRKVLNSLRQDLLPTNMEAREFQIKYGIGLIKSKDYRDSKVILPEIDPITRKVLITYQTIAVNEPVYAINDDLIQRIVAKTGIGASKVEKILSTLALSQRLGGFEEKYIKLSTGGTETAKEFEIASNGIFSIQGFGFTTKYIANTPLNPDILVYFDHKNKRHGIIDTKAYKEYSLQVDHRNKMAYNYVPTFREITYEGNTYKLAFFCYIAGGFNSTMQRSLNELVEIANMNGSYITAIDFVKLLEHHRHNPISVEKFGEIFSSNKQIVFKGDLS